MRKNPDKTISYRLWFIFSLYPYPVVAEIFHGLASDGIGKRIEIPLK